MPYVAHAAVELQRNQYECRKDEWHFIKSVENIAYHWRLRKDLTYEVVSWLFDDPFVALKYAKQMYVTLFYSVIKKGLPIEKAGCERYQHLIFVPEFDGDEASFYENEEFFFWNKKKHGGHLGPNVFEVEKSIDELSDYKYYSFSVLFSIPNTVLNFDNADQYLFLYSKESQELLNSIVSAEKTESIGMRMTIYCSLLEHLAENKNRDPESLEVIDKIVELIDKESLSQDKKNSLKGLIISGRNLSATQKCLELCAKYANEKYGDYTCKKIVTEAYKVRSAFSHGDGNSSCSKCVLLMKDIVLDVIKNYIREREITLL